MKLNPERWPSPSTRTIQAFFFCYNPHIMKFGQWHPDIEDKARRDAAKTAESVAKKEAKARKDAGNPEAPLSNNNDEEGGIRRDAKGNRVE